MENLINEPTLEEIMQILVSSTIKVQERLVILIQSIWYQEVMPSSWNTPILFPVRKKGYKTLVRIIEGYRLWT